MHAYTVFPPAVGFIGIISISGLDSQFAAISSNVSAKKSGPSPPLKPESLQSMQADSCQDVPLSPGRPPT